MKRKLLGICLGISLVMNLAMCGFIMRRGPVCEYRHLYEIDRTRDVIPDRNAAKKMAEVYLEDFFGFHKDMDMPYETYIVFDEKNYEWTVKFYLADPPRLDGSWSVTMRRDYGIATDFSR